MTKALKIRTDAANACVEIMDTEFFRALCEPARVEIFKQLILKGRSDIGTIAEDLPQDRSVVARHLQVMERAGLLRVQQEGRHTFYEIDGPAMAARIDKLSALVHGLMSFCCPGKPS